MRKKKTGFSLARLHCENKETGQGDGPYSQPSKAETRRMKIIAEKQQKSSLAAMQLEWEKMQFSPLFCTLEQESSWADG